MPFSPKLLNEGEEVVLDLHPHWWYLSGSMATVVVVLAATIAGLIGNVASGLEFVGVIALVLSLGWLLVRYSRWRTTSFVLTNHRVVHRSGRIAKRGREIPLDHINDISYSQTIGGRLIGAGTLTIESAGERGQEVFPDLPRPSRIQNEIYKQMEGGKARQAGSRELSIPEQIEKLDELRQRGVLSQAEFEASKAELLHRL
jgi:uncharacterized membrane protein YdbT with pleckstrin-like domain